MAVEVMLATVDLHDELMSQADEIHDVTLAR
jgi:hypothetical protein